jgi:DNA helicase-2/ATP-dependent DNA helicase PcrA
MVTAHIKLNTEQTDAVLAHEGAFAVISGPGSGKTQVLVSRYNRLIESGVDPQDILALTFTAEAARNMRTRAKAKESTAERPSGFRTFHSLALSFAQIERGHFPYTLASFPLAVEDGLYAVEAVRKYRVNYKDLRTYISHQKRKRIAPDQAIADAADQKQINLAMAYRMYDQQCCKHGVLDFDSLIVEMVNLLESNAGVRGRWQYKFVQTDESQDSDWLQWRAVQLMSEKYGNVFAVGDAGQCIFEWRSAHPELFLNMEKMFPNVKKLFLAKNHRSTKEIVSLVRELGPVKELAERFYTENEQGAAPRITRYDNNYAEAEGVVEEIKRLNGRLF